MAVEAIGGVLLPFVNELLGNANSNEPIYFYSSKLAAHGYPDYISGE
ncbi:TPA: hypothetical protein HA361_05055 [Candidatus Woesearchaeota archaeon]|nr:hypothetical protein [Candidatus Woesearchaeota archaeon]